MNKYCNDDHDRGHNHYNEDDDEIHIKDRNDWDNYHERDDGDNRGDTNNDNNGDDEINTERRARITNLRYLCTTTMKYSIVNPVKLIRKIHKNTSKTRSI